MTTMKPQYALVGSRFWLQWVLASILGFAVGAVMGNAVTDLIFTALFGVAGGFTQWLVLRHRIPVQTHYLGYGHDSGYRGYRGYCEAKCAG